MGKWYWLFLFCKSGQSHLYIPKGLLPAKCHWFDEIVGYLARIKNCGKLLIQPTRLGIKTCRMVSTPLILHTGTMSYFFCSKGFEVQICWQSCDLWCWWTRQQVCLHPTWAWLKTLFNKEREVDTSHLSQAWGLWEAFKCVWECIHPELCLQ